MNKGLLVFLTCFGASSLFADDGQVIKKSCVSESGLSIYDIEIKADKNFAGEIRYRFSGQDIFYTAQTRLIEKNKLIGVAEFSSSRSGETSGTNWIYTYDTKKNTLMDNDNVTAKCN